MARVVLVAARDEESNTSCEGAVLVDDVSMDITDAEVINGLPFGVVVTVTDPRDGASWSRPVAANTTRRMVAIARNAIAARQLRAPYQHGIARLLTEAELARRVLVTMEIS